MGDYLKETLAFVYYGSIVHIRPKNQEEQESAGNADHLPVTHVNCRGHDVQQLQTSSRKIVPGNDLPSTHLLP